MALPKSSFLVLLLSVSLAACSEPASQDPTEAVSSEAVADEVAEATGAAPSTDSTPCEVLSDELLTKHFDLSSAEVKKTPSKRAPHPFCKASWKKPNAAEIEEERKQAMMEYMRKKLSGEEVKRPSLRTTSSVTLTLAKEAYGERQATLSAFDRAMRVLSEGMTVETDAGSTRTPTYDYEPVDGIGEKAAWVPGMHQLSVATAHRIFHVAVRIDGGLSAERERAKEVARDVAQRL